MTALRQRMLEELTLRNYSPKTVTTYVNHVAQFARHYGRSPETLAKEDVRKYLLYLLQERKLSASSLNCALCSLRFLYRKVLGREGMVDTIPYAKRPKKLPVVLSQDEVLRCLAALDGMNRVIALTMYGAGLRITEAITLRVADIDSQRLLIHVRQGKGRKDRLVPLPENLLQILRAHYRIHRPKSWLFPGRTADGHVSGRSLQRAICSIRHVVGKPITTHTLRHSFATHLMEDGVNIRVVQGLLGHQRLSTTSVYNHVSRPNISKPKSPLDGVEL